MAADPGSERWEATWEEGRLTEDRLGDHTAKRYRHFQRFVDADDGTALDENLFGYVLSAEGIRDEMKQYEEATAIVRLAETGFFVRKLRQMNSLLDAVRDSYEVKESPELADWRAGLQQERKERMDMYDEFLDTDRVGGGVDVASARIWELTGDLEVEEALTLLKSGVEKFIDDTLTEQEISTIQTAFNMIARHSGMIVTTIPDWFVSPFSFGGSFGISRWGNDLFVPEHCDRDRVIRDANIWSRLNHPHIVKFLGACHIGTRPFFVHEKVKPLTEVLHGVSDREVVWRLLCEVALCLFYLSERGLGFGGFSIDDVCCAQYEDKAMMRGVGMIEAKVSLSKADDSFLSSDLALSALMIMDMRALGFCVYDALYLLDQVTANYRVRIFDDAGEIPCGRSRKLPSTRPTFITEEEWKHIVLRLTVASPHISVAPVIKLLSIPAELREKVDTSEISQIADQLASNRDVYDIVASSVGLPLGELMRQCDENISEPLTKILERVSHVLENLGHRDYHETVYSEMGMLLADISTVLNQFSSFGQWSPSDPNGYEHIVSRRKAIWVSYHLEIDRILAKHDLEHSTLIHSWKPEFALILEDSFQPPTNYRIEGPCDANQDDAGEDRANCDIQSILQYFGSMSISRSVHNIINDEYQRSNIPNRNQWIHQKWFIPPHEIESLEFDEFGDAAFSTMSYGQWLDNSVIVKRMNIDGNEDRMAKAGFFREADVWFGLNHINIVKMYGATYTDAPIIVCECVSGGEIPEYLQRLGRDTRIVWQSLLDAALGLQYLHNSGVAHGDIKGNNILVGSDGVVKLAHFGLSRLMNDDNKGGALGTIRWKAPEQISTDDDPGQPPSFPSDVYSFALLMIEIVSGEVPWGFHIPDTEIRSRIKCGHFPVQPKEIAKAEWHLIGRMCCFNPSDRVTIDYVVAHLSSLVERLELDQHPRSSARGEMSLTSVKNHFVSREGAVQSVMNLKKSKNHRLSSIAAIHLFAVHPNRLEVINNRDIVNIDELVINGNDDKISWATDDRNSKMAELVDSGTANATKNDDSSLAFADNDEKRYENDLDEVNSQIVDISNLATAFADGAPLRSYIVDRLRDLQRDERAVACLLQQNMQPLVTFRNILEMLHMYHEHITDLTPMASRIVLTKLKMIFEAVKTQSVNNSAILAWNSQCEQECQRILENTAADICSALSICNNEQRIEFVQLLQYELRKHKDEYSELYRSTVEAVLSSDEIEAVCKSPIHDWFIPWYEIELLEVPPRNRIGQSVRGVWEGKAVVVTFISDRTFGDEATFRQNVSNWFALSHPNVVKLVGACHVGIRCIVCEPVDCSLDDLIHQQTVVPWRPLLNQVARGLAHLHDQGIVHGDVRARHIFVKDGVAKLGRLSFRLGKLRGHFANLSLRWMAPELLANHHTSPESDVYSFGMMIIEAATKKPPWRTIGLAIIVRRRVLDKKLPKRPRSSELESAEWELVTQEICAYEPGQRPHMSVVAQNLSEINDMNEKPVTIAVPRSKQTISMLDEWRSPVTQKLVADELEELEDKCNRMSDSDLDCTWIHKYLQEVWDTLHEIDEGDLQHGHEAIEQCTRLISNWNECLGLRLGQHPLERFELPRSFLDELERLRSELVDLCADFEIASPCLQTIDFKTHALSVVKRLNSSNELDILPELSTHQLEEILTSLMVIAKHRRGEYNPEYCDALAEYVDQIASHRQLKLIAPEWYVRRSNVSSDLVNTEGNQSSYKSVRRSAWHDGSVVVVKYIWKNVSSAFIECVEEWRGCGNHPHVLPLHGACHVGLPQFMVCEFARKGNFVEYFRNGKNAHVRWQRFLEASKSLHHLHDQKHAHGNIRPTNLLVGGDGKAKLGDIGFAEFNRKCMRIGELDAFPRDLWSAPELSKEENMTSTPAADIYAFGMCILASYLGEEELSLRFGGKAYDDALDDTLRPSEMEDDGWGLVKKMCSRDSNARPNAHIVVSSLDALAKSSAADGCENDGSIDLMSLLDEGNLDGAVISLDKLDEALKSGTDSMVSPLRDRIRTFYKWLVGQNIEPPTSVVRRCQRIADRLITVLNTRFDSSIKFFELITSRHLATAVFDLHSELDYLEKMLDVPDEYRLPTWKAEWDEQRRCQINELVTACDSLNDLSFEKIHEALQYLQFERTMYRGSYPPEVVEEFGTIINASATRLTISTLVSGWFVPPYEIDFQQRGLLGEGSLGKVYSGEWQGMNVAVKTVLSEGEVRNTVQCTTSTEVFANEASVWFRLNHPHVIKLYCACPIVPTWNSESLLQQRYFVCEFAGKGTLKDFVAEGEDLSSAQRPREVWEKLYEGALGLQYLHECGIVHGDLKGDNILIGSDNRAKLSDFGFSTTACAKTDADKPNGSFLWMAPECLHKDSPLPLSVTSDIYSFGMCILQTISRQLPWCNVQRINSAAVRYHHKANIFPMRPTGFSDSQWSLVKDMCCYDPDQRISMQDAIQRLAVEAGVQEIHARDRAMIRPCDHDAVRSAIAKLEEKCSQMKESEALIRLMHGRLEQLCNGLQALDDPLYAQQHQRRFLVVNVVDRLMSSLHDHMRHVELMRLATNTTFLDGLTAIRDEIQNLAKLWGLPDTVGTDIEWDIVVRAQKEQLVEVALQSQRYIGRRSSDAQDREALAFVETLVEFPSTHMSPEDRSFLENMWFEVKEVRQIMKSLGRRWFLPQHMIVPPPTTEQHCSFPHGSFGQLRLNTLKFSGSTFDHHTVAVKWLFAGVMGLADKFLKPLDDWFELSHPNVIELIGAYHVSASSFIVSEYASNGNFDSYLSTSAGKKRLWQLFLEAALGLQYLHMKKIVHGNLKSTNLLVDANGKAKLSDFGLSKLLDQSKSKSVQRERDEIRWMAPERLFIDPDANSSIPFGASDVFSLGRCLAAALTGAPPLADQSDTDIINALLDKTPYIKPAKPNINDEQWEFVQELCEVDPSKRLMIKQAIERFRQFASHEE